MSNETTSASETERSSPTVCLLCRQRKTRCDRRLPKCGFCTKSKVECQYVKQPMKRGLRAGYVSELEARIANLEQEVGELKDQRATTFENASYSFPVTGISQASPNVTPQLHSSPVQVQVQIVSASTADSANKDLMSLPHSFFHYNADLWFKETQIWVPVLNREQIQTSLEALPTPVDRIDNIELRAVMALRISHSTQAISLGYSGRRRLSQHLRSQVLVEAMAKPSMSSLRALLIIAILDYGSDNIPSTFSLLAICRRMCENIGTFRQLLKRIEAESPAQVGPPTVEMPATDDTIPLTWCILAFDAVSTLGISWRDVSAALVDHLSSVAFISTPDFRDSFRTHTHLAAIGLQPVHEFFSAQARYANMMENSFGQCEEMYLNLMSYVDGLPETSYTLLPDGIVDFDICQIFTHVQAHATIIMIYQRFVLHDEQHVAQVARQRCLDSCAMIVNTMRSVSDADTEISISPVVATLAFVAARLKLVLCKALAQPREPLFDILMHSINMLGRRWQYARRLDIVLRVAIVELDEGSALSLPAEFWDLKQSHLEISESLKAWVIQHRPSLYIGNLDGPYA